MKTISWIIVLASMALLQWHSINTWIGFSDKVSGSIMSVLVEVLAMYYAYNKERVLATITYGFVICFALYHLGDKVINTKDILAKKEVIKKQEQIVMNVLDSIKDKSYPITIQKTLASLDSIKQTKDDIYTIPLSKYGTIFILGSVLILVMIGQLKAILFLSSESAKKSIENKNEVSSDKVELPQIANRTTKNKLYDKDLTILCKKVLLELENKRLKLGLKRTEFMGDNKLIDVNKNNYSKIEKVIECKEGGIGFPKLREIQSMLEDIDNKSEVG